MRYHYQKPEEYFTQYGKLHICNHRVYSRCTLFNLYGKGIAVIQQRFDEDLKHTYWTEIDPWLNDILYLHPSFLSFFEKRAYYPINDIYPTVTIRQIMWALKMKPLPKERWETVFDRSDI